MRIGELSAETGVPITTIRYYEDIGVLAAPVPSRDTATTTITCQIGSGS